MLEQEFIEEQWATHLDAPHGLRFREFLQRTADDKGHRELIESWGEFLRLVHNKFLQPQNPSVYSYAKIEGNLQRQGGRAPIYDAARINTIFFDFDQKNLTVAWIETKRLRGYFLEHNMIPRIYYSGNRGFHLYVDFPEVKLAYPRKVLKAYAKRLQREINLSSLDCSPMGNLAGHSRLPYTSHEKTGLYCIPLATHDFTRQVDYIVHFATEANLRFLPVEKHPSDDMTCVLEIEDQIKEYQAQHPPKFKHRPRSKKEDEKMIELLLDHAPYIKDGRKRILWRLLIPRLTYLKDAEVYAICQQFVERSSQRWGKYRAYVRSTLKDTRRGGWGPASLPAFVQKYPDLAPYLESLIDQLEGVD